MGGEGWFQPITEEHFQWLFANCTSWLTSTNPRGSTAQKVDWLILIRLNLNISQYHVIILYFSRQGKMDWRKFIALLAIGASAQGTYLYICFLSWLEKKQMSFLPTYDYLQNFIDKFCLTENQWFCVFLQFRKHNRRSIWKNYLRPKTQHAPNHGTF